MTPTAPDTNDLRTRILRDPGPSASAGASDGGEADLTAVLAGLAAHGTPLVTDDPDDPASQRVLLTFLAPSDTSGVYAWANRLTDGPNQGRGHLRRWGGTDLWFTELTVARSSMATYRFYAYTDDDPNLHDGTLSYSRAVAQQAVSDPTNRHANSPFGSVLCTAGAPDLMNHETADPPAVIATGIVDGDNADGGPGSARWRLIAPVGQGAGPPRIIVVFDAHKWFDEYGLPAMLAAALGTEDAADDIGPIALLGIDAPTDPAARMRQLGPNRDFLAAIVDDVLGKTRRALNVTTATTVWAGQSLGAVSALAAAHWFPDAVDAVLAYSPSMWWKPGLTSRPTQPPGGPSWITAELANASPCPVRLAVGRNEVLLVEPVAELADELTAAGWPTTVHRFNGGHDIAWWTHLLIDDLTTPNGKGVQQ